MPDLTNLHVKELIAVIHRARGCGCCQDTDIPDGCPVEVEEDNDYAYVDHTYDKGCSQSFGGLLDLLVEAAKKEA